MGNIIQFPRVEKPCYIHPVAVAMFGYNLPICTYIHDQPLRRTA